jgi:hypothetical protein
LKEEKDRSDKIELQKEKQRLLAQQDLDKKRVDDQRK